MGMDETARGTHAIDGTKVVSGQMSIPATIETLAPAATTSVLWVLAKCLAFRAQHARKLIFQDYLDILWRSKLKLYQKRNRATLVGNDLCTFDMRTG